jgi:AhpD family alkylhydroperoxidase
LTPKDKELIAAYVSGLNACQYCYGVHAQTALAFGVSEGVLTQLLAEKALDTLIDYAIINDVNVDAVEPLD